jgi:hypothetical protein
MKYWEIAGNLSKAGWSWGCVSAVDLNGRAIFVADAHRDGQRFVVRADEKLSAFLQLESVIRHCKRRARICARIGLAYIIVGHVRHHTGRSAGAVPGRRGKLTR